MQSSVPVGGVLRNGGELTLLELAGNDQKSGKIASKPRMGRNVIAQGNALGQRFNRVPTSPQGAQQS
jgi:hypothetical protein